MSIFISISVIIVAFILLACPEIGAAVNPEEVESKTEKYPFPACMKEDFNYCRWMAYNIDSPLADKIYYSNGKVTAVELGDMVSGQGFNIAQDSSIPEVTSCVCRLFNLDTVCAYDFAIQESFGSSFSVFSKAEISYEGDRIVYDFDFHPLLHGHIEEYIPWNSNSLVHKITLSRPAKGKLQDKRVRLAVRTFAKELRQVEYDPLNECLHLFDFSKPFHAVAKSSVHVESHSINPPNFGIPTEKPYSKGKRRLSYRVGVLGLPFSIDLGESISFDIVFSFGITKEKALAEAERVLADKDRLSSTTKRFWNKYYASCPKVTPHTEIVYTNQVSGKRHVITAEELVKSQLWYWHGLLTNVCRAEYLPCSPITIADWNQFAGMWGNDGIEEAVALSYTNQKELAKKCIINWFKYSVNYKKGDGHCCWTLYPSGLNTFDHIGGSDEHTESVPLQGHVVGSYIRATGDLSILDTELGERAKGRTLWQQLKAYEENILKVRDVNGDHLLEWVHDYETGWDNKYSPFIKSRRAATTAINEQVFRLWSLSELTYLSRLKGEDPAFWVKEMDTIKSVIEKRLWCEENGFYHDYDAKNNTLWVKAQNLDAYYWLFYESEAGRIEKIINKLNDPRKFNASLLPTLSLDNPHFRRDGYWDGRAWPRVHSYVGVALSRVGYADLGFQWVARAIMANLGPICPETLDPLVDPVEKSFVGNCRLMGYNALNCVALPDISGLQMWAGENLTLVLHLNLPKIYITEQKWNGDSYNAILVPDKEITLYQNDKEVGSFGYGAKFEFIDINLNLGLIDFEATLQEGYQGPTFISFPRDANIFINGILVKEIRARDNYILPTDKSKHLIKIKFVNNL